MTAPNVLIVPGGKQAGAIRGQQIGDAIGARVTHKPRPRDWDWADVVILVKKAMVQWGVVAAAHRSPVLWDVLDFWQQPAQNDDPLAQVIDDVQRWQAVVPGCRLICATQAMASDLGGTYIPHHIRPGLTPRPVRDRVEVVAYEGLEKYLGSWRCHLERACAARGLQFVVNPPDLSEADLIVALRGEEWDGQVCRRWKSGVKIVNAIGAGRPILAQRCAAVEEIGPIGGNVLPGTLDDLIDFWSDRGVRETCADACRTFAPSYSLDAIATRYRTVILQTVGLAA